MNELELILESEYNNAGDLIGLDADLSGAILGKAQRLSPLKRIQMLRKLAPRTPRSRGSRAEMEKQFRSLPKRVRTELAAGKMRLGDWSAYAIKAVSSKTIKLFETQDDKEVSIRNLSNAKLPKNMILMVAEIQLIAGIASTTGQNPPSSDQIKSIDFQSLSRFPALANGEWSLKSNKVQLVPENTPLRKFVTDQNHQVNLGTYKLDNPRPLQDDVLLEFVAELGTMNGLPDHLYLRVELSGTVTTP